MQLTAVVRRYWYLPLLVALMAPLVIWLGLNVGFALFASRDLGPVHPARATPTAEPVLLAAIQLVQSSPCSSGTSTVGARPDLRDADWSARRSQDDPHAYYVAASDPHVERLEAIWQVEGGQVLRLWDEHCTALPAGNGGRLAEAVVLLSPSTAR